MKMLYETGDRCKKLRVEIKKEKMPRNNEVPKFSFDVNCVDDDGWVWINIHDTIVLLMLIHDYRQSNWSFSCNCRADLEGTKEEIITILNKITQGFKIEFIDPKRVIPQK